MQRYEQTTEELLHKLSPIMADWNDDLSKRVMAIFDNIVPKLAYSKEDIGEFLDKDFDAGYTAIRTILDLPKDELELTLKSKMGDGGIGVTRYKHGREQYLQILEELGVVGTLTQLVNRKLRWQDILVERIKAGRGSAIKGQRRGRYLENWVEDIIKRVFGSDKNYDARCRFIGNDEKNEKTDFAIPDKKQPRILIESKAYGATGSKQTDILGDVEKIISIKRFDTHFLLVTDGTTWAARKSDLAKLVRLQNEGKITRIYTLCMAYELETDLRQLKNEHGL